MMIIYLYNEASIEKFMKKILKNIYVFARLKSNIYKKIETI